MNEESVNATLRNHRRASNVDLTIISNQLLITVVEWEISKAAQTTASLNTQ
jgi:hypothetical protein